MKTITETTVKITEDMQKQLAQRYINRQDAHTQKTIEIIGRKKYKKLLENGIAMVSYDIKKQNQRVHAEHIQRLENTIFVLSTLLSQLGYQHKSDHPNHQSQSHT